MLRSRRSHRLEQMGPGFELTTQSRRHQGSSREADMRLLQRQLQWRSALKKDVVGEAWKPSQLCRSCRCSSRVMTCLATRMGITNVLECDGP